MRKLDSVENKNSIRGITGKAMWGRSMVCRRARGVHENFKFNINDRQPTQERILCLFILFLQKLLAAKNLNLERLPFRDAYLFQYGILPDQYKPPR